MVSIPVSIMGVTQTLSMQQNVWSCGSYSTASRNMLLVCTLFICWNKLVRNLFDDVFMYELHVKDIALCGDSCS